MSHTVALFSKNGIDFKLDHSGKWWQLYYLNNQHWEALSIWSTRQEAFEAAACFVPARHMT